MVPTLLPRADATRASPNDAPRSNERGQALVEFAMVLLPLILVLVAIVQFGFLFSAYVGVSNAAREGARAGTIYQYDANDGQGTNDHNRCLEVLAAAEQSLDAAVPGQFNGTCAAVTGGGDLEIAYTDSATCTGTSRTGCQIRVTLNYHQPLFVPLVGAFLSADGSNQIGLSAAVTMVLN